MGIVRDTGVSEAWPTWIFRFVDLRAQNLLNNIGTDTRIYNLAEFWSHDLQVGRCKWVVRHAHQPLLTTRVGRLGQVTYILRRHHGVHYDGHLPTLVHDCPCFDLAFAMHGLPTNIRHAGVIRSLFLLGHLYLMDVLSGEVQRTKHSWLKRNHAAFSKFSNYSILKSEHRPIMYSIKE